MTASRPPQGDLVDPAGLMDASIRAIQAFRAGRITEVPPGDDPLAEEVRSLGHHLVGQARAELRTVVTFSRNASEAMAAVAFLTGDVREVASNAETITLAVDELNSAISEVASVSAAISNDASAADRATQVGLAAVHEAIGAMGAITHSVSATAEQVERLNHGSDEIGQIAGVIERIAKQTNLLALNATIEAARAGEAGRGFSVVASEVKELANQTAKATERISGQIDELRSHMAVLLEGIGQTSSVVATGEEAIQRAGTEIEGIAGRVHDVMLRVEANAASVTEQTAATEEVARSVGIIAQKAQRSAGHAERAVQSVSETEQLLSKRMEALVALGVPGQVLELAKSDHVVWKKRLAELLIGRRTLERGALTDHHKCRLGTWYDSVKDPVLLGNPDFAALKEPHAEVHTHAMEVVRLFTDGQRQEAEAAYQRMEAASDRVLELLERIGSAAYS